jgi:hypothetical protein
VAVHPPPHVQNPVSRPYEFEARATVTGKGDTAALGDAKVKEFDMSGGK